MMRRRRIGTRRRKTAKPLTGLLLLWAWPAAAADPLFVDVARGVGLDFVGEVGATFADGERLRVFGPARISRPVWSDPARDAVRRCVFW